MPNPEAGENVNEGPPVPAGSEVIMWRTTVLLVLVCGVFMWSALWAVAEAAMR
jgi:hypothetical protein